MQSFSVAVVVAVVEFLQYSAVTVEPVLVAEPVVLMIQQKKDLVMKGLMVCSPTLETKVMTYYYC